MFNRVDHLKAFGIGVSGEESINGAETIEEEIFHKTQGVQAREHADGNLIFF